MKSLKLTQSLMYDFSKMNIENSEDYDTLGSRAEAEKLSKNRIAVIEFLNLIENQLNKIILFYFLGNYHYKSVRRDY